ncbi:MAG: protein kinase [Planctomycetia bacterium]|nr:protein kinase [Planctomycetia bacterium]
MADETAHSQNAARKVIDPTEYLSSQTENLNNTENLNGRTENLTSQTDATLMRDAPSADTVNEKADATSFGKYDLVGELARGGMGVVYRARQHGLDRHVALKMILGTGIDQEAAQRFLQEARAAAALDHPNVVPIYDIGEIGNRPYFTMALIDGPNLRGHVEASGLPTIPAAVSLFAQIVAGVAHAHKHGIIHRDIKPANVLIDKDGRPRVTDFGLAKRSAVDSQLTATGQVVGTPSYMAPEQARDSKEVGPPADVYALGAVLYFILTGQPPFHGDNVTDLLIKVVMEQPVPPRTRNPEVPDDLEVLCLKCLAKLPTDRFSDALALFDALMPIADRYLTPSSGLTPSSPQLALQRTPSTGSVGSTPGLPTASSVQSLSSAFPTTQATAVSPTPASVPASPTAPAPNRTPVIVGLSVAALLLIGTIAFLATRDGNKNTETPPDNPKAAPVTPDAEKFAWPAATRADFRLDVVLQAPAAKKEADGTLLLTAGTPMEVHLTADRDCRVSVWAIDPAGKVLRLFPNTDEPDDHLTANRERVIPGNKAYTLETTPTEGAGVERLRVIATTGAQPVFPAGAKKERFTFYGTNPEREQLASAVRGIVIKKAEAGTPSVGDVAEREILFRVQK